MQQSHATKNGPAAADHEAACARVAARFGERWLRIYALRKLRSDPVFPTAFELLAGSDQPLVDVGCGVGLLAFYLRERNFRPPISGLDTDSRKIERANAVSGGVYDDLQFIEQDACDPIAETGNLVLFDLLHYLRPEDQVRLLDRLARRVAPGGMLAIRDCPRDNNGRYWLTYFAERFAQATTWNMKAPLHFPIREKIFSAFPEDQFSRAVEPLWGRTPFNNHLFIFRRRAGATVPAQAARNDSLRS